MRRLFIWAAIASTFLAVASGSHAATITVTSPNGGERWVKGTTHSITWTSSGVFGKVKIQYKKGIVTGTIADNVSNTGTYSWAIPSSQETRTDYKILITSKDDSTVKDESNSTFTIADPDPALAVTSPNGGETWTAGTTHNITWSAVSIPVNADIKIELLKGASVNRTITSTGRNKTYSWTVPSTQTDGSDYRVRLTYVSQPSVQDTSDSYFNIDHVVGSITVTSPNGGERWVRGTTQSITWNSSGVGSSVKIEYKKGIVTGTITSSTSNDGNYTWSIPSSMETRNDYKIIVTSLSDSSVKDESNSTFTIADPDPALSVTSPNGGETWTAGTTHNITWSSVSIPVNADIKIELLKGSSVNRTITSTARNGTHSWTVPSTQTDGSDYRVRLTYVSSPSVQDTSDSYFSIDHVVGSITVTSPNGGERWVRGTTQSITWNSSGVSGNVKIEYKKGIVTGTIASSVANTGSYSWSIPTSQETRNDYKIVVTSLADSSVKDESNSTFTIADPDAALSVTSPNGGETWTAGSSHSITWSSVSIPINADIKIELLKGGSVNRTITSTAQNGSYSWTIPIDVTAASDYRIKLTYVAQPTTTDQSDANFAIGSPGQIILIAPNGGEMWGPGSTQQIRWTGTGLDATSVAIGLWEDEVFTTMIATATANDGTFDWTLPAGLAGNQFKVKIETLDNPVNVSDWSDANFSIGDFGAPTPNPMTWVYRQGPRPASISSITMTATTATDPEGNGVEYYFDETSGNAGANDSGWQDSSTYTDSGLSAGVTYSYRVKARDKSASQNETAYSAVEYSGVNDAYEVDDDMVSQAKTITLGSPQNHTFHNQDDIDNVKFDGTASHTYRVETYNVASGWGMNVQLVQVDPGGSTTLASQLNETGGVSFQHKVTESRTYYVRLTQRSGTGSGNYTLKVTDLGILDPNPPTPNPMTWVYRQGPRPASMSSITMTATTATDPEGNGVEYFFDETSGNSGGTDSGWQDSPTYTDTGLSAGKTYAYRVAARDKSSAHNETAFSATEYSGVNDAYEADDDMVNQAKTIAPGTPQDHTFHNQDDIDNLKFDGIANHTYRVETYDVDGGWGTSVGLYKYDSGYGSTMLANQVNVAGGVVFDCKVHESRTYYIRVTQRTGSGSGAYSIRVLDVTPTGDQYEVDDTFQAASLIGAGGSQTHTIHTPGDWDYIRFSARAGQTYIVETYGLSGEMDSYLELYASDGSTRLAYNDNGGEGDASRITYNSEQDALYYLRVTHKSNGTGTYSIRVSEESPVLTLLGLEVTQAVQDLRNSVPLLEGRRTIVRAHVKSSIGTVRNVTARLYGTRDGVPLPSSPLWPYNQMFINVKQNPNRGSWWDSFCFTLPSEWCSGSVELEFLGVGDEFTNEEADGTSDGKVAISFQDCPLVPLHLVKLTWTDEEDAEHAVSEDDLQEVLEQLLATMPMSVDIKAITTMRQTLLHDAPGTTFLTDWRQINTAVDYLRLRNILTGVDSPETYYIVVITGYGSRSGVAGQSFSLGNMLPLMDGKVLAGYMDSGYTTLPHEFGHAAGRMHTDYNAQRGISPMENALYIGDIPVVLPIGFQTDFVPQSGAIGIVDEQYHPDAVYGYNVFNRDIFNSATADIMSYGYSKWTAPFTYKAILEELLRRHVPENAGSSQKAAFANLTSEGVSTKQLLVAGAVSLSSNSGHFSQAEILESEEDTATTTGNVYSVDYWASGAKRASFPFEPNSATDSELAGFVLNLPWDTNVTDVLLCRSGVVLDQMTFTTNPIALQVISPNGGEMFAQTHVSARWACSATNAPYDVDFSTDGGGTWTRVLTGLGTNECILPPENLGSTTQGLLKVTIHSGLQSVSDQSDGTFTILNQAPVVDIVTPCSNNVYGAGTVVALQGSASDPEEGVLPDAFLEWSSHIDGPLGSGQRIEIESSLLAEGMHLITLIGTDTEGNASSRSVPIEVSRSVLSVPRSMSCVPESLQFYGTEGVSNRQERSLSLDMQNAIATPWQMDQKPSWVLVNCTTGVTPTIVKVRIDAMGLTTGIHTGSVVFVSSGTQEVVSASVDVSVFISADSNANSIPDGWELQFFGGPTNCNALLDSDGDGMINGDEYVAGTDPRDSESVLRFTQCSPVGGGLELCFPSVALRTYGLQVSSNLFSAWHNGLSPLPGDGFDKAFLVPATNMMFYRVTVEKE